MIFESLALFALHDCLQWAECAPPQHSKLEPLDGQSLCGAQWHCLSGHWRTICTGGGRWPGNTATQQQNRNTHGPLPRRRLLESCAPLLIRLYCQVLEDINKKEAAKKKGEDHERVIQQRCGVHTGQCVAGVLGSTTLAYDIWGDDVTYAGLMESNGVPGKVQVSSTTYSLIKQHFKASPRELKIKGHGLVSAYLIDGFNEAEAS